MLNEKKLFSLTKGDKALTLSFLTIFITHTGNDIEELKKSSTQADPKLQYYYIHKINSSLKSIGFEKTQKLLSAIETDFLNERKFSEFSHKIEMAITQCEEAIKETKIISKKYVV